MVLQDLLALQVFQVIQVWKVLLVIQVIPDAMDPRVNREDLVFQVCQDPLDLLEDLVLLGRKVIQENH